MKMNMYLQTMTVVADRSRNTRFAINKCLAKTEYIYLTDLAVTEPLHVIQAALAYIEELKYFKSLGISYVADQVSGFYSVHFTVAGETILPDEFTLDTDDFEELGDAYTKE